MKWASAALQQRHVTRRAGTALNFRYLKEWYKNRGLGAVLANPRIWNDLHRWLREYA